MKCGVYRLHTSSNQDEEMAILDSESPVLRALQRPLYLSQYYVNPVAYGTVYSLLEELGSNLLSSVAGLHGE